MNAILAFENRADSAWEESEAFQEAVRQKIDELQSGDYDWQKPENVQEALGNMAPPEYEEIVQSILSGDKLDVGQMISQHIEIYWIKRSENDAVDLVKSSWKLKAA